MTVQQEPPEEPATVPFTVRLPEPLHRWLRHYAFATESSMNQFITAAAEQRRQQIEDGTIEAPPSGIWPSGTGAQ